MNHTEIANHTPHWKSTSLAFASATPMTGRELARSAHNWNVGILEMWNNGIKEFYQFKKAYLFFFPNIPLFQYSAIS